MESATITPNVSSADRRRAPRRQPALGTVINLDIPAGEYRQGLVWNLSSTGVSLLLPEPVDPGTMMMGSLSADDGSHLPVQMKVAHVCLLRTGDYFLGAQFERALTPEEMRPFVVAGS